LVGVEDRNSAHAERGAWLKISFENAAIVAGECYLKRIITCLPAAHLGRLSRLSMSPGWLPRAASDQTRSPRAMLVRIELL
jgi:hypothetical protein